MNQCNHNNVTFVGLYSLIGNYVCDDCGEEIEPVKYHQMKKMPHVRLDENNKIIKDTKKAWDRARWHPDNEGHG